MNRKVYVFILLTIPVLFSCHRKTEKVRTNLPVSVDVIIAEKIHFPSSIEVNGETLSEEMIELHPEISGRLTYLNIPDGATVQKGTILAKINDADMQAQLEQQKVQLELALKTEKRLKELLAVNGINQSDYDAALSQVNTIKANIKVLNAQIDKTIVRAAFRESLLKSLEADAIKTYQSYESTLQQLESQQKSYADAGKLVSLLVQKFRLNEATILDLKAAQDSFESAGYMFVNLQYAAKTAEIELKRLIYKLGID